MGGDPDPASTRPALERRTACRRGRCKLVGRPVRRCRQPREGGRCVRRSRPRRRRPPRPARGDPRGLARRRATPAVPSRSSRPCRRRPHPGAVRRRGRAPRAIGGAGRTGRRADGRRGDRPDGSGPRAGALRAAARAGRDRDGVQVAAPGDRRALQAFLETGCLRSDIVAAVALVNDALDGATMLALTALTERIETVREEFLASTIHDVRQPITLVEASLVLASRWVRRPPTDLDRLAETLDGALYATQEMSQLIDTLADASRVAMGAVDVDAGAGHRARRRQRRPRAARSGEPGADRRRRPGLGRDRRLGPASGAPHRHQPALERAQVLGAAMAASGCRRRATATGRRSRSSTRASASSPRSSTSCSGATAGRTTRGRAASRASASACTRPRASRVAHGGRIELESDGRDQGVRARLELPVTAAADA